jgi:hypothetical protein
MRKTMVAVAATAASLGSINVMAADQSTESTSVTGKAFIDFTSIDQKSNGTKLDNSGNGIDVKRFYVGIDHKFDDTWSANVTTDFNYVSNDGETQVYIKKAYVQAKVSDAFVFRAGSADLPWVPYAEGLYGYRYVENVLIDQLKFGTSADWGLNASGKAADGMLNYSLSVINGAGYKNPTRSKNVDIEGRVSVVVLDGLNLAAGFYSGKLGQEVQSNSAEHTATRYNLLAAYVAKQFRVGAEYFSATNWKQVQSTSTDKADGFSVWGSYDLSNKYAVFARYDDAKPSKDLAPSMKSKYLNIGAAYKPRKGLDLAFVVKQAKVENGSWSTSNGTIGGSTDGKYTEAGLWAQVSF